MNEFWCKLNILNCIGSIIMIDGIQFTWKWSNGKTYIIKSSFNFAIITKYRIIGYNCIYEKMKHYKYLVVNKNRLKLTDELDKGDEIIFDNIQKHMDEIDTYSNNIKILEQYGCIYDRFDLDNKFKINPDLPIIYVLYYIIENYDTHVLKMDVAHDSTIDGYMSLDEFNNSDFNKPIIIKEDLLILMPKRTNYTKLDRCHIPNTRGNKRFIRNMLGHIEMFNQLGPVGYYEKQLGINGKKV